MEVKLATTSRGSKHTYSHDMWMTNDRNVVYSLLHIRVFTLPDKDPVCGFDKMHMMDLVAEGSSFAFSASS